MPLLSVLTAAIGEWPELVAEAGESLAGQKLPDGWELEWIVQEDGPEPVLGELVERFPFARYQSSGARLGVAGTRNLALVRVAGELIQVLDCDDVILPGGLAVVVQTFQAHPEIHWVAAQADDLLADGTRKAFEPIHPPGYVERRVVGDFVLAHRKAPFLPNGVALRTDIVRAVGGWPSVPTDESGLLLAVTELAPGYYTSEVTWAYRQHERQTSRRADWRMWAQVSWDVVGQRVAACRSIGLRIGR